jgi:hypothetical protein
MGILANSEFIVVGFTVALTITFPQVSSAQPVWAFDDLLGGLGSSETPTTANPKAQLAANVVSVNTVDCEKALAIVADYGFKDVRAKNCSGGTLGFTATRDGKPFSIRIFAADGEFAEVKRLQ